MRVFILKEGKEYNQGVAYLDDGTMVVVDNARKMIGKTVDVAVTSVLQTTAGKMIFGRFDDRIHAVHDKTQAERHDKAPREVAPVGAHGWSGKFSDDRRHRELQGEAEERRSAAAIRKVAHGRSKRRVVNRGRRRQRRGSHR